MHGWVVGLCVRCSPPGGRGPAAPARGQSRADLGACSSLACCLLSGQDPRAQEPSFRGGPTRPLTPNSLAQCPSVSRGPVRGHSRLFSLEAACPLLSLRCPRRGPCGGPARRSPPGELVKRRLGPGQSCPPWSGPDSEGWSPREVGSRLTADIEASDWGRSAGGSPGAQGLDPTALSTLAQAERATWRGSHCLSEDRTVCPCRVLPAPGLG